MKLALCALVTIISFQVLAEPLTSLTKQVEQLNQEDRLTYYSVASMCEREESRSFAEKSSLWVNAFTDASLVSNLAHRTSPLNFSHKLEAMTSSPGFFLALERCYGNDDQQKSLFFFTLLSLDVSGKFSSWITEVTLLKAVYFGLRGVYAAGFAVMPQRWMWFRFIFGTIMSRKLFWKVSPTHLLLSAFTVDTASDLYLTFRKARDEQNLMSGQTREKIELLQEENQHFQTQMAISRDAKEIQLYKVFISQNQREIDEIRRQMK